MRYVHFAREMRPNKRYRCDNSKFKRSMHHWDDFQVMISGGVQAPIAPVVVNVPLLPTAAEHSLLLLLLRGSDDDDDDELT